MANKGASSPLKDFTTHTTLEFEQREMGHGAHADNPHFQIDSIAKMHECKIA